MSHIMLQPRFPPVSGAAIPDALPEPGKILKHKDTQILFKMTIGELAQNSPGLGSWFPPPSYIDGLGPGLCATTWPPPSLPPSHAHAAWVGSASGQAVRLGLCPDTPHFCWK